jgi:very-short-patch-repair endonuclease
MSQSEKKLWSGLKHFRKDYGLHVRRQAPIGPYIADFYIHAARLIIEVDGEHHQTADQYHKDIKRDRWMGAHNYHVVRLSTGEVWHDTDACLATILHHCRASIDPMKVSA